MRSYLVCINQGHGSVGSRPACQRGSPFPIPQFSHGSISLQRVLSLRDIPISSPGRTIQSLSMSQRQRGSDASQPYLYRADNLFGSPFVSRPTCFYSPWASPIHSTDGKCGSSHLISDTNVPVQGSLCWSTASLQICHPPPTQGPCWIK